MQLSKITFTKWTILIAAVGISLLFFFMIKGFFMALVLSAIFSGIMYRVFEFLSRKLGGRRGLASALTILIFILAILIPTVVFIFIVVEEAIHAGDTLVPTIQDKLNHPEALVQDLESIGFIHQIFPDPQKLLELVEQAVKGIGEFVVVSLEHITSGALNFFFQLFIFLFAMYYFLLHGKEYLNKILYYLPLKTAQERLMVEKFLTVTRSNLRGTLIIGVVQGASTAAVMALVGIKNTLFWGLVIMVLSIIPALGPAMVWIPASVLLVMSGQVVQGVILAAFGAIFVGNIDNILRPRIMGKATHLPDLMILIGTLGGLAFFGMAGIIVGPIVAALFVTIWEIYGEAFKDQLQPVEIMEEMPQENPPPPLETKDVSKA